MDTIKILTIAGSLRKASFTQQIVEALPALAPDGVEITNFKLHDIPVYNQDLEVDGTFPAEVQKLRDAIAAADAIIFATPEYNGGMSGVLKNAIDWASRQGLLGKIPVAPISGSPGALGATKGQEQLRAVLGHLGMYVMARPSVAIPQFNQKIADGVITDEKTQAFVSDWLKAFQAWVIQLNK